jgi:phosphate-selective porin OprO/OprP
MTGLNSATALPFIERPLPFAFLPFRQIGAMLHGTGQDDASTWAVSVFRFPTDLFGSNVGDNGGFGFTTRLTGLLVDDDERIVHVGAAYNFADPSSNAIQYATGPEFFVGQTGVAALSPPLVGSAMPAFVNTGAIAANNYNLFGGEFAARAGSFYTQAEVLVTAVDRIGGGTAVFPGVYVHAGYFLTGEVRPYDRKAGVLGRVSPLEPFSRSGGRGAWEVAARWSMLDLNDAGIRGGRLNDITLGLNWYLNTYVKFQLNYIHAMLNSPVNGHSEADIAALRAQLIF